MICATGKEPDCNGTAPMSPSLSINNSQNHQPSGRSSSHRLALAFGTSLGCMCLLILGDFGLVKLLDHQDSNVTTAVRGTVGHIALDYLSTYQSSEKTDVFGFEILLLELITGHRYLEFGKAANQKGTMIYWIST